MKKIFYIVLAVIFVALVAFAGITVSNKGGEEKQSGVNQQIAVQTIYGEEMRMSSSTMPTTGTTTIAYNLGEQVDDWALKITTSPNATFATHVPSFYFYNEYTNESNCAASTTDPDIIWHNTMPTPTTTQAYADGTYEFGTIGKLTYSVTAPSAATSTYVLPMLSEAMAKCVKTTFYNNSTTDAFGLWVELIKKEIK